MLRRYRICGPIDSSGTTAVEALRGSCESAQGTKPVTIKRLRSEFRQDRRFTTTFQCELTTCLPLRHTNIQQVLDSWLAEGTRSAVLECVDGCTLQELQALQKRKRGWRPFLPVPVSIFLVAEICRALDHVQTATQGDENPGYVIRPTPNRILLSTTGEVKLAAFSGDTAIRRLIGDRGLPYLAPEELSGADADASSAMFLAGTVLWEALAGRHPFLGRTDAETMELIRAAKLPSLARENPDVDSELEGLIVRVLSRYERAGELADALVQYSRSRGFVVSDDVGLLARRTRQSSQTDLRPAHELEVQVSLSGRHLGTQVFRVDSVTVGREKGSLLRLDHHSVSSEQAQIDVLGRDCMIQDLGARNGILINGTRMPREGLALIRQGDEVRVGSYDLRCAVHEKLTSHATLEPTRTLVTRNTSPFRPVISTGAPLAPCAEDPSPASADTVPVPELPPPVTSPLLAHVPLQDPMLAPAPATQCGTKQGGLLTGLAESPYVLVPAQIAPLGLEITIELVDRSLPPTEYLEAQSGLMHECFHLLANLSQRCMRHLALPRVISAGFANGGFRVVFAGWWLNLERLLMPRTRLQPDLATWVCIELAEALEALHQGCDTIHGTICLSNIWIGEGGPVLAGLTGAAPPCAGSPRSERALAYASPEWLLGGGGDERSEVFSLAAVLYRLIVGEPPMRSAASLRAGLPPELQELMETGLACEPSRRFSSIRLFRAAAAKALGGLTSSHPFVHDRTLIDLFKQSGELLGDPAALSLDDALGAAPVTLPVLQVVVSNRRTPVSCTLHRLEVTVSVGSGEAQDVRLDDPSVSAAHAELRVDRATGLVGVRALGRMGVALAGRKLKLGIWHTVSTGPQRGIIAIGDYTLCCAVLGPRPATVIPSRRQRVTEADLGSLSSQEPVGYRGGGGLGHDRPGSTDRPLLQFPDGGRMRCPRCYQLLAVTRPGGDFARCPICGARFLPIPTGLLASRETTWLRMDEALPSPDHYAYLLASAADGQPFLPHPYSPVVTIKWPRLGVRLGDYLAAQQGLASELRYLRHNSAHFLLRDWGIAEGQFCILAGTRQTTDLRKVRADVLANNTSVGAVELALIAKGAIVGLSGLERAGMIHGGLSALSSVALCSAGVVLQDFSRAQAMSSLCGEEATHAAFGLGRRRDAVDLIDAIRQIPCHPGPLCDLLMRLTPDTLDTVNSLALPSSGDPYQIQQSAALRATPQDALRVARPEGAMLQALAVDGEDVVSEVAWESVEATLTLVSASIERRSDVLLVRNTSGEPIEVASGDNVTRLVAGHACEVPCRHGRPVRITDAEMSTVVVIPWERDFFRTLSADSSEVPQPPADDSTRSVAGRGVCAPSGGQDREAVASNSSSRVEQSATDARAVATSGAGSGEVPSESPREAGNALSLVVGLTALAAGERPPPVVQATQPRVREPVIQTVQPTLWDVIVDIGTVLRGHQRLAERIGVAILLNQHVLLEGLPGIGKTEAVKKFAERLGLVFTRIQFGADTQPADITGSYVVLPTEDDSGSTSRLTFVHGPIFGHLVLLDELNRAPPRVKSALLEPMEEKTVTPPGMDTMPLVPPAPTKRGQWGPSREGSGSKAVGRSADEEAAAREAAAREAAAREAAAKEAAAKESLEQLLELTALDSHQKQVARESAAAAKAATKEAAVKAKSKISIMVATQNPGEQEGVFPLTEAELDRFLMLLLVPYPTRLEWEQILLSYAAGTGKRPARVTMSEDALRQEQERVAEIALSPQIQDCILSLHCALQPVEWLADAYATKSLSSANILALFRIYREQAESDSKRFWSLKDPDVASLLHSRKKGPSTEDERTEEERKRAEESIKEFFQTLKRETRGKQETLRLQVQVGPSTRALQRLSDATRAHAYLLQCKERHKSTLKWSPPEEALMHRALVEVAEDVLRHRVRLTPDAADSTTPAAIIRSALESFVKKDGEPCPLCRSGLKK